jgi:hypothetical protein
MVTGNFTRLSAGRAEFCANSVQNFQLPSISLEKLVRIAGLEPACLAALPPQSSVSANSTICALGRIIKQPAPPKARRFSGPAGRSSVEQMAPAAPVHQLGAL